MSRKMAPSFSRNFVFKADHGFVGSIGGMIFTARLLKKNFRDRLCAV